MAAVGTPAVAPSIAAAVAPAIAAATTARLPAFDPSMVERLPNTTSRVAFLDKWVNRRIDEATGTTARMDAQLAQLQRAQSALQKLGETLRADMSAVAPTMKLLQSAQEKARETAQKMAEEMGPSIAAKLQQITGEQMQAALTEARPAVESALAPAEQECAARLEATLQKTEARVDAATKHALLNTREELRLMQEQWLATAGRVRDSLNQTLTAAQASASQLAETIEKTLASAGQAVEALTRHAIRSPQIAPEITPAIDWPPASPEAETSTAERRLTPKPSVKVTLRHPVAAAGEQAIRALDAASVLLNRAA
jgi:hypothetical protein